MVFPVVRYRYKRWTIKKAECNGTDAFKLWYWRRLLRVSWTARRWKQSILKEINKSWIFIGKTDANAETPVLWPSHLKSWLIGKDSDAGRDWGQEEKGTTEDEMVGWHHQLNGHEFEWVLGVSYGQEVWSAAVHGVSKSQTWLNNWTNWMMNMGYISSIWKSPGFWRRFQVNRYFTKAVNKHWEKGMNRRQAAHSIVCVSC